MTGSIWIFGYGSLVHRPGFEHARRVQGYVPDFKRVWHQGSTDHRGTPERPGRVVTLEPSPGALTWGVAYELTGDEKQQLETLRYLEWREKQYDVRHLVDVYGDPDQDVYSPPPAVDISHLMPEAAAATAVTTTIHTQAAVTATSSTSVLTPSSSTPALPTPSTEQETAATALVNSISSPALITTQPPALTTGTESMSSFDPLLSSDEVQAYKPPDDWQRLRCIEHIPPACDGNRKDASAQHPIGPDGSIKGTRLLLRNVLCYIASSDVERNHNYLGPAPLDAIAHQVVGAEGPSGPNWVYVVRLAAAMRQMGVEDPELFALESKVLQLRNQYNTM